MRRSSTKTRIVILACAAGALALTAFSVLALRPVVRARRAIRLLAATQVGQTGVEEFRRMASSHGVRVRETSDTFDLSEQNSVLRYLHLAPPTVILMNARFAHGVISGITVQGWVGSSREFAKVEIEEFDSHNTGCGDVPVCIKPTTSTMLTTVFFVPSVPPDQRARLLGLNTWCLAKVGGCRNSREMFPTAWEFKAAQ